jgi:hypothetical protein
MEVRRGDRSTVVAWGKEASTFRYIVPRTVRSSAATPEQAREIEELEAFFQDPTAWTLPGRMYVQPETSPFVPSRIEVTWDRGEPDWSELPSPAREIVSGTLDTLLRDGCQIISTDQARQIAQLTTQAGLETGYDVRRGTLSISTPSSFFHSFPALPHEVVC